MNDTTSGFSFGTPPNLGKAAPANDDAAEEIEAIEVSGEPISRVEAKDLGLVQFDDTTRDAKKTSQAFRADRLPPGTSPELAQKLKRAWEHLKRDETEEALTLAQEVVWELPDLVDAKVIIARCFINRKEYEKALAILEAIPEDDMTGEALYYTGVCLSQLGRVRDAIEALKLTKAKSDDATTRKRANDLLLRLQREQTVCPVCGKKVRYDNLVEAGGEMLCSHCAKNVPDDEDGDDDEDDGDDDWDDDGTGKKKRRKRLRPPMTKSDLLMRLAILVVILVAAYLGLYIMSFVAPSFYATTHEYIPESMSFLFPTPEMSVPDQVPQPNDNPPPPPRTIPPPPFNSPPLTQVVAGVETRHPISVEGMDASKGMLEAIFSPTPAGSHTLDAKKAVLVWTPAASDAGKTFDVTFTGLFGNIRTRDQVNKVTVTPGPSFKKLYGMGPQKPGRLHHLLAADLGTDDAKSLIMVHGDFWEGEIVDFEELPNGNLQPATKTPFSGRPVGVGVIMADQEKWLAVADYWSSRIRYFALRNGSLSEMATDIDLPGRPIAAGFDRKSSISAVICSTESGIRLACHRQDGQMRSSRLGEWALPDESVWRRVVIVPGDEENSMEPIPVVIGGDISGSIHFADFVQDRIVPIKLSSGGAIVDAIQGKGRRIHCLVENEGKLRIVSFNVAADGMAVDETSVEAGNAPALGGMAGINFLGRNDAFDIALFSSTQLGISFEQDDYRLSQTAYWNLSTPYLLKTRGTALPASNERLERMVFLDDKGDLWSAEFPKIMGVTQ